MSGTTVQRLLSNLWRSNKDQNCSSRNQTALNHMPRVSIAPRVTEAGGLSARPALAGSGVHLYDKNLNFRRAAPALI